MAMGSTARAYPNSDASKSENPPSLSPFRLVQHVKYSGAPRHLRNTVLAMIDASEKPGLLLWPAVKGIMIETGACRRTVQNNLRRLVKEGLLEIVKFRDAKFGSEEQICNVWVNRDHFRRSATYRINLTRFSSYPRQKEIRSDEWRTYREYKAVARKRPPQHDAQGAAIPPQAATIPITPSPTNGHRSTGRSLTPRQRKELADRISLYQSGVTQLEWSEARVGTDLAIKPGDPRYVKPLSHEAAVLAACMSMARGDPKRALEPHGVAFEKAREAAEEMEQGP
jgi:hypothetical protein